MSGTEEVAEPAKRRFYKRPKFWIAVGALLVLLIILVSLTADNGRAIDAQTDILVAAYPRLADDWEALKPMLRQLGRSFAYTENEAQKVFNVVGTISEGRTTISSEDLETVFALARIYEADLETAAEAYGMCLRGKISGMEALGVPSPTILSLCLSR